MPTDPLTRDIAAAVEVLRDRRDLRREYVTFQEIIDKEKEISRQEALKEGRVETLMELVRDGVITEEEAAKRIQE